MGVVRLCAVLAALTGVFSQCGVYPVIQVYEHCPDAIDPVLISAERGGDTVQGQAGMTYAFHVTANTTGQPDDDAEYHWVTNTGRTSSGWQPLPANGIIAVETFDDETWLKFRVEFTVPRCAANVTVLLIDGPRP